MALEILKVQPNPKKTVNGRAVQVDHPFKPGRKVNTNGEEIQDCAFIQRRLKDKDLVLCDAKKPKSSGPAHQGKKKDVTNTPKKKTVDSGSSDN